AHGAGVPGDGRLGEAGQLGDRELLLDLAERLGGRAPPRAEHDRGAERLLPGAVAQLVRCFSGQDGRIGGQGRLSSRSSVPAVILPPQPPRWQRSAPFSIAPRRRPAGPGAEKGRAPGPAPTPPPSAGDGSAGCPTGARGVRPRAAPHPPASGSGALLSSPWPRVRHWGG